MREALSETRAEGFPISCLYPSTQALYRQVGYEQAGHRFALRIPLAGIDVRERNARVVPLDDGRDAEVRACYTEFARAQDGWLDRGPFAWARIREQRGERFYGFGVETRGTLDGYVFLGQRVKPETGRHDLAMSDLAFRTPEAGRRLLGFLADFATVGDDAILAGGPHHPLLWLLGQQRYTLAFKSYWMLRLTDVRGALAARGYPDGVSVDVSLDVRDEVLEENSGCYRLRVEGGAAQVEPCDGAEVRLHVRALAALWAGFQSPAQLRIAGGIEGTERGLGALEAVFRGGAPAMTDMF